MRRFLIAALLATVPASELMADDIPLMPEVVMGQVSGPGRGVYRPVPEGFNYLYSAPRINERLKGKPFIDIVQSLDLANCIINDGVRTQVGSRNEIVEVVRYYTPTGCKMVISFISKSELRPLGELPPATIK